MIRAALAATLAAVVLAACGAPPCMCVGNPYVPPSASISPGAGFDAVVTEHDTAVTIHTGQKLELVLHARPGMSSWANIRSGDTSVLAPIANPAASVVRGLGSPRTQGEASEFVGAVTLAAFQAQNKGTAVVTASAGAACSPGQACPQFAILYSLTVTVT